MAFAASVALARAGAFLNDPSNVTYTQTLLLPHIQSAMLRLQMGFLENDLPVTEEATATLEIIANQAGLTQATTPAIPVDLVLPYRLWGKPDTGTEDDWSEIIQVEVLPAHVSVEEIPTEWVWREGSIYWIASTGTWDAKVLYEKTLTAIAATTTSITLIDTELYLAAQTAAFAALILGGNVDLSGSLQGIADDQYKRCINNRVMETQNLPVRRKAYGHYRRARRQRGI